MPPASSLSPLLPESSKAQPTKRGRETRSPVLGSVHQPTRSLHVTPGGLKNNKKGNRKVYNTWRSPGKTQRPQSSWQEALSKIQTGFLLLGKPGERKVPRAADGTWRHRAEGCNSHRAPGPSGNWEGAQRGSGLRRDETEPCRWGTSSKSVKSWVVAALSFRRKMSMSRGGGQGEVWSRMVPGWVTDPKRMYRTSAEAQPREREGQKALFLI